jgi:crotonobetainyl-CoA:carnitine CoA-transferase CaiB-like acyl-CoA transferase
MNSAGRRAAKGRRAVQREFFCSANKVGAGPSPTIGQHNTEIYAGWLGLSPAEIAELKDSGVI